MLQLLEGALLKIIESEIVKLEPAAQSFALNELKIFSDMLFKYIDSKLPKISDDAAAKVE
jgi:hypothetical protein